MVRIRFRVENWDKARVRDERGKIYYTVKKYLKIKSC